MDILEKHQLYNREIDSLVYLGAKNHCVNYGEFIINFKDGTYLGFLPKYNSSNGKNSWILCEDRNYPVKGENNKFVVEEKLDINFYKNNSFYTVIEKYKDKKIEYLKITKSDIIMKIDTDVLVIKVITDKKELSNIDIVYSHGIDRGSELIKDFKINMLFSMQIA